MRTGLALSLTLHLLILLLLLGFSSMPRKLEIQEQKPLIISLTNIRDKTASPKKNRPGKEADEDKLFKNSSGSLSDPETKTALTKNLPSATDIAAVTVQKQPSEKAVQDSNTTAEANPDKSAVLVQKADKAVESGKKKTDKKAESITQKKAESAQSRQSDKKAKSPTNTAKQQAKAATKKPPAKEQAVPEPKGKAGEKKKQDTFTRNILKSLEEEQRKKSESLDDIMESAVEDSELGEEGITEMDAIRKIVSDNWQATSFSGGSNNVDMSVQVVVKLDKRGNVQSAVPKRNSIRDRNDPVYRAFVESAIRAVINSSPLPLEYLPPDKYSVWQEIEMSFNTNGMVE